jgi:hypothetical protein
MFDAKQMFKQKNLTPSSADQAEFVANFYERMLEEGQGDGVTRFSDDILFLISVFLCVVTSSVVRSTVWSRQHGRYGARPRTGTPRRATVFHGHGARRPDGRHRERGDH